MKIFLKINSVFYFLIVIFFYLINDGFSYENRNEYENKAIFIINDFVKYLSSFDSDTYLNDAIKDIGNIILFFEKIKDNLKQERSNIYNQQNNLLVEYDSLKKMKNNESELTKIHKEILNYEVNIEELGRQIKKHNEIIRQLNEKIKYLNKSIENNKILNELQNVKNELKLNSAKYKNLKSSGASPDELIRLREKIDSLKDAYESILIRQGYVKSVAVSIIEKFIADVPDNADMESFLRKDNTDNYEYRYDKRSEYESINYKRINESNNNVRQVKADKSIKVDKRLVVPKINHEKPAKTIEKINRKGDL